MKKRITKRFDCVQMKRRIQERIYAETRGMGHDELIEYFRRRIASSQFAYVLHEDGAPKARAKA